MRIISTKNRIAKKHHSCDLCGLYITPSTLYNVQKSVDQGDIYEFKAHLSCIDIAKKLDMWDNADDGLTLEIFKQSINDEYGNIIKNKSIKDGGLCFFTQILDYVKAFHLKQSIT